MPDVTINGKTIVLERFTLSKATRVITLLKLIHNQMPEITKQWATYRRMYADEYAREIPRLNAVAQFGEALEHIPESEWERAGQKLMVPAQPSMAETFFELAPVVYEGAEEVALRLLGLLALPNEVVNRYVKQGDIWERVDELVDDTIRTAPLDDILELLTVSAELIDQQILQRLEQMGNRAGNVLRLVGWKKKTDQTQQGPATSSEPAEQQSSPTSERSLNNEDGPQTSSEDSTGMIVSVSSTPTPSPA